MTATVYYYIIWLNVPLNQQTMHIFIIYYLYEKYISSYFISTLVSLGLQKKNRIPQKVKLAHTAHQERDMLLWGEGSKSYCHMSLAPFCVSVSTQFVAFLEALHYEKYLYHITLKLTWTYPDFDSFLTPPEKFKFALLQRGGDGSVNKSLCPNSSCPIQDQGEGGKLELASIPNYASLAIVRMNGMVNFLRW